MGSEWRGGKLSPHSTLAALLRVILDSAATVIFRTLNSLSAEG